MDKLEDKIYEYFRLQEKLVILPPLRDKPREIIAHDIAEIAGEDCIDKLGDMIKTMEEYDVRIELLEKENADLKLQLADTLGRFEGEMELNTKVMKEIAEIKERFKADECDLLKATIAKLQEDGDKDTETIVKERLYYENVLNQKNNKISRLEQNIAKMEKYYCIERATCNKLWDWNRN